MAKRNIWPFGSRTTYRVTRKPGPGLKAGAESFKGAKIWQYGDVWKTDVDPASDFDTKRDVKAFVSWAKKNPGKSRGAKSAAYEAGRRALAAAAARHGTVNLTPSIAQRDEWGWAWREFMAGWNAEAKSTPNPGPKLGVYSLTMRQGTKIPTQHGIYTGLTNARQAAEKQGGAHFIGEVVDSQKKKVGYVVPSPDFTVAALRGLVESNIGNPGAPGSAFKRCVAEVEAKGGAHDPRAVCAAAGRKKYGAKAFQAMAAAGKKRASKRKGNPAAEAAEAYKEFHGRPSGEVVTVKQKLHYHAHLAALGELRKIVVRALDGGKVTLSDFGSSILAENEAKNQMFVEGGDQSVDLEEFGIFEPHEVETLGEVLEVAYFTTKDHLGKEGGTAIFFHETGETNEGGRRKKVGWPPDLIYYVRDKRLVFSGGSYIIRAEGIDK